MDVKTRTTDRWSEEQLNVLWEIWPLTFTRGGFDTYNPPEQRVGVMAGGADGGFSLYVSGKPAASGQHWVQCPRPEGAAAAWQGMNQITLLFLSAARRPSLSAPHHPCVALYTIIHLGIPVFSEPRSFLPWRKGSVFFYQVFVKEGTLMNVSRRSQQPRHLFLVNSHAIPLQPLKPYKPSDDCCWPLVHLCVNQRVAASPSASRLSY